MDWINPVSEAFIAGCVGLGIPRNADYNSGDQAGVGYFQRAILRGRRVSAARAFLKPALSRPQHRGPHQRARQPPSCSTASARSASATSAQRGGAGAEVRAGREVVAVRRHGEHGAAAAGLGVGPAALLGKLGVPVVHELRGVGENFRDHYASRIVMRARPGVQTLNQLARGVRLGAQVARWAHGRPSILATAPSHVHVFWKSFEGLDVPDLQCVFTPGSYAEGKVYVLDDYPGVTAGAWQHRPESTGWVRARSADVFEDPEISPNYLSDPMDRRVHLGGMRLLRRMLAHARAGRASWKPRPCPAPRRRPTTNCWTSPSATAPPPTT